MENSYLYNVCHVKKRTIDNTQSSFGIWVCEYKATKLIKIFQL
jgi:hypothetical protein